MTPKPHFTCPRCQTPSWHPLDLREGYCARCDDWTACAGGSAVHTYGPVAEDFEGLRLCQRCPHIVWWPPLPPRQRKPRSP